MDVEQKHVEEDLRGQIAGDVLCDDLYVQLYSSDASIYEIRPLGVVRPRSVDDVVATVQYAAEHGISLHPRGSGSGLAGESLGRGLIVDFSRYFRRILETDASSVRVQAGVVLNRLNAHLARQNRLFGPDPAMSHVTTLGSVVALNAAGSRWPRYGSARDHLLSMQVVLATGEVVRLNNPTWKGPTGANYLAESHGVLANSKNIPGKQEGDERQSLDPVSRLTTGMENILRRHANSVRDHRPRSLVNRSGYQLFDLQRGDQLDLGQLVAGSEGTLVIVTEVTLSTDPLPQLAGSTLFFFDSLDKAARAAIELSALGLVACDLMDRRHLSLARESDPRYELLIPQAAEAVLLVEYHADSADSLRAQLEATCQQLLEKTQLASSCYVAEDSLDHELLWQLSRHYVPLLYRLQGSTRPVPFIEDIAVPPAALPQFIQQLQTTLKQQHVTASIFGHALHGQLHVRPFLDLADRVDVRKMETLATELYARVWDLGGTISGEHGDGLSRTPYLEGQYGDLTQAFREVKELFDPQGLFNPGKVVPRASLPSSSNSNSPDPISPTCLTDNLRQIGYVIDNTQLAGQATTTGDSAEVIALQLDWQPQEMAYAARVCNGCAACRSQESDTRMCPIFRYAPREEASPRAKANLARGLLAGLLPSTAVYEESWKKIADLCVHCHMCRLECPANVDIPKLMVEAKAAYLETNGQGLHDWVLTRVDSLCEIASRMSRLANWAVANRFARWLIEKTLGIAQGRKLPRFAQQPFLQVATQRRLHRTVPLSSYSVPCDDGSNRNDSTGSQNTIEKVLYFVDTYANYCDTQLAEALVAILEHNQISVYVPNKQRYAALTMITQGMLDPARQVAEQNVALLAEAVRQGYTIVCTEPSATLALTHEYPMLLGEDPDARLVATHTMDACHYLWRWHQQGKLQLDFEALPMSVGYHVPCHVKALDIGTPTEKLLGLIPELQVERLEKGCSGIAGTYGLKHKNYRNSLRAGLPLLTSIRSGQFQVGVTECSACKIQMEQGTHKPTIHPIKLLALAYGLKQEFRQLLNRPIEELVVT